MTHGSPAPLRIDFVADVVCPWCYLGWRAMHRAVASAETSTEITWRPYLLDPSVPPAGVDRAAYMAAKFPDRSRLDGVHETLKAMASELGAPMDLARIAVTPNTLGAHQLIRLALSMGRQDQVVDAVMLGYFAQGKDIGDPDVLCDIGEAAGIDRMTALQALADASGAQAIANEYGTAAEAGVTGVPFAIFNGAMSVAGAQSPERYALAIRKAASRAMVGGD